jgi:unsaturated rhamnogalacturonyl hydrolase
MMNLRKSLLLGMVTLCFAPLTAQTKMTAKEAAMKIADRILSSTAYEFKNTKTGEVYKTVKNLPLSTDVKVASKYNAWHYTNGVTNIALLELADKTGDKKYNEYVS